MWWRLRRRVFGGWVLALAVLCLPTTDAAADTRLPDRPADRPIVKNPFKSPAMFRKGFANFSVDVEELENEEAALIRARQAAPVNAAAPETPQRAPQNQVNAAEQRGMIAAKNPLTDGTNGPLVVGDFKPEDLLPPDQTPQVRLNPDAPAPIFGIMSCMRTGDKECAAKYADQWVRYQQNFFFEVRELTQLIGEAMIRQGQIDDDDWRGVPQYIDYEFAQARRATNDLFKPSHDIAMKRIKADSKNQAGVYYFFNFNCEWCRVMAPDVERLYQLTKNDPNVKMIGLTLGKVPKEWLEEYRAYTGLTMPIMEGDEVAKSFGVRYAPAIVIVAPNDKRAYRKTGAQTFERMYDFVRHVQGLPSTITPEYQRVAALKIGEIENAKVKPGKNLSVWLRDENERRIVERRLNAQQQAPQKAASAEPKRPKGKSEIVEKF